MFENGDLVEVDGTVGIVCATFTRDDKVHVATLRKNVEYTKTRGIEEFTNGQLTLISKEKFVAQVKVLTKEDGLKAYCAMLENLKQDRIKSVSKKRNHEDYPALLKKIEKRQELIDLLSC